jgi:hypothetical protein
VHHTSSSWVALWETPSQTQGLNLNYIRRLKYLGEAWTLSKSNKLISNDAAEIQIVRCSVQWDNTQLNNIGEHKTCWVRAGDQTDKGLDGRRQLDISWRLGNSVFTSFFLDN